MNILITGIQGSGKGTLAKRICQEYNFFTYLESSALLKVDPVAKAEIAQGHFISSEIVLSIWDRVLSENKNKFLILDGFPRSLEQLKWFTQKNKIDIVLNINASLSTVKNRMLNIRKREDDTIEKIEERINQFIKCTIPMINDLENQTTVRFIDVEGEVSTPEEIFQTQVKPILDRLINK